MLRFSFLLLVLLLSACNVTPPITEQNSHWRLHLQQLHTLDDWQLSGKVAFISPSKRQTANLFWEQNKQHSLMRLTGPLGIELLELRFNQDTVWLRDNDGNEHTGSDADALLKRLSGWPIPASQLSQWLLGIPTDNDYQLNPQHRLATATTTQDWQVDYLNYSDYAPYILPRQLQFSRSGTTIKLNIHNWQIHE